jgi:hypothetical protein
LLLLRPAIAAEPFHFISAVTGEVTVVRPRTSFRAAAGTVLRANDLLQFASGASATVVCADLSMVKLPREPGRLAGNPCKSRGAIISYGDAEYSAARAGVIPRPALHAPAHSLTLSDRPTLHWFPAAADPERKRNYVIQVSEGTTLRGRAVLTSSPATYPENTPPLETDRRLVFGVGLDDGKVPPWRVEFQRLHASEQAIVNEQLSRVAALDLPSAAAAIVRSRILAAHNAKYEALIELAGVTDATLGGAVEMARGKLSLEAGFADVARLDFERAIQLAHERGDLRGEAAARDLLAACLSSLGDVASAVREYRSELALLDQLGEGDRDRVSTSIRRLEKK